MGDEGTPRFTPLLVDEDGAGAENGMRAPTFSVLDKPTGVMGSLGRRWRDASSGVRALVTCVVALLVCGTVGVAVAVAVSKSGSSSPSMNGKPLNVIFMVSDGFGPSGETMARVFADKTKRLPLDEHIVGTTITYSTSSLVTDSAAGATCYSCAEKTYNGAIAVTADGLPCATLIEAASARGMATGIVVTSRVTHATPASFSAHVRNREQEQLIAEQQVTQDLDLMFGGGRCEFQPKSGATESVSCRCDDRDLLAEAADAGTHVVTDLAGFEALNADSLPVLGLFAESHLSYEIDRVPTDQPSLLQMTETALSLLSASDKARTEGFFLLIEGSRIDMAGHNNDPAAHVHETLAFQDAFQAAITWAAEDGNTIVISTSDHETGGLALARTIDVDGKPTYPYEWSPEVLAAATHSCEYLADWLKDDPALDMATVVAENLNVTDLTAAQLDELARARLPNASTYDLTYALSALISYKAHIGWSTHGHTGVDVNLYAYGPHTERIHGVQQNSAVGAFMEDVLGFDLAALTPEIQNRFTHLPPRNVSDLCPHADADPAFTGALGRLRSRTWGDHH